MYTINCSENTNNFIINNDDETMSKHQGIMDKEIIMKVRGDNLLIKEVRLHHVKNIMIKHGMLRCEWRETTTKMRQKYVEIAKPKIEVKYYNVKIENIIEMEIY